MATVEKQKNSNKPHAEVRVAGKGATPPTPPKADKPAKEKKEAKAAKPVLDKVFGRVAKSVRSLAKVLNTVKQFTGQGSEEEKGISMQIHAKLTEARDGAGSTLEMLGKLKGLGFEPKVAKVEKGEGGGRTAKPDLAPDVHVWVKLKRRGEYEGAFSTEDLGNLFVDKVVGTKVLVRIGEAASEGKVAKMIGFVPKSHITTVMPVPTTDA